MEMMIRTLSLHSRQQVLAILDAAIPAPPIAGFFLHRKLCDGDWCKN